MGLHWGRESPSPDAPIPSGLSLHLAFLALQVVRAGTGQAAVGGSKVAPVWGSWLSERNSSSQISWAGAARRFHGKRVLLTFVHLNCVGSEETEAMGEDGGQELTAQRGQAWACCSGSQRSCECAQGPGPSSQVLHCCPAPWNLFFLFFFTFL